jgi:glutamate N-acetyltransferase/amino-acid N-acetyltransferase
MPLKTSPLAPLNFPQLPAVPGVVISTAQAGVRYANRTDVLLMQFAEGTTVAGVYTRSKCPSAPVDWCREAMAYGGARALVVNSGNANAFTGLKGREAVRLTADAASKAVKCAPHEVYLASTGVIGEPLDATKIAAVLPELVANPTKSGWEMAARAIMTTDTFPKGAFRIVTLDGANITLTGIAKGAGMIAPDMATLLSFVATDAPIAQDVLQSLLAAAVESSFNCVTVDGDTSTSDTLLAFATGTAQGCAPITRTDDPRAAQFGAALRAVLEDLAQQVARDGEGATKFITVEVTGAASDISARKIGLSIANSPLVKTAIAGEDANWGRVVMAVGKAGEPADRDRLSIWFGDLRVAFSGTRDDSYNEAEVSAYMKQRGIVITVDLGLGQGTATVWTCDLTHDYIAINADYRS